MIHHHGHFLLVLGVHCGGPDVELVQELALVGEDEADRLPCLHLNGFGLVEVVPERDLDRARGGGGLGRLADRGAVGVSGIGKGRAGERPCRGGKRQSRDRTKQAFSCRHNTNPCSKYRLKPIAATSHAASKQSVKSAAATSNTAPS